MSNEYLYRKNDLAESYYLCPLFKRYCQYNLWFGNYNELDNIRYCKKYIKKYIRLSIEKYILQYFNLSVLYILYSSPRFTKFVESGFFKYLDFHFLLLFYKNCFNCSSKDKKKIKIFVHVYLKKYVKYRLKHDLLICINNSINESTPIFFRIYLLNYINVFFIVDKHIFLNNKILLKSCMYDRNNNNNFLINCLIKNIFYGVSLFNCQKESISFVKHNSDLNYFYKSVENLKFSKYYLTSIVFNLNLKKNYIFFFSKTNIQLNKDIQILAERLENLRGFSINYKSIGLYNECVSY